MFQELVEDRGLLFRYHRITPGRFEHLLSSVKHRIAKKGAKFQNPISARERLSLTLHFLATGESQQSISFSYRTGRTAVSNIVFETCEAIFEALKVDYLQAPKDSEGWEKISEKPGELWDFPHVLGAINGTHIRIECPKNSGTLYYNYKDYYSLVLLAVCGANYCFTRFDIGSYDSNNDNGILTNSEMDARLENQSFDLRRDTDLVACVGFLLGDEIFPLTSRLLKPFSGRNLPKDNYRHSRA